MGCRPPARWEYPVVSNGEGSASEGGSANSSPPSCRPPWRQTSLGCRPPRCRPPLGCRPLLEADPPPWRQTSLGCRPPPDADLPWDAHPSWMQIPLPWRQIPRMQTPLLDADPLCEQTDRCKNITLPQTSFAGGKNSVIDISVQKNLIVMKTAYNVQFLVHISLFLT